MSAKKSPKFYVHPTYLGTTRFSTWEITEEENGEYTRIGGIYDSKGEAVKFLDFYCRDIEHPNFVISAF